MRAFELVFGILVLPVFLLNLAGGVVSGLWLAYLGDWRSIGFGFLVALISRFLTVAFIPGVLVFGGISAGCFTKNWNVPGLLFLFLSNVYVSAITIAWCLGVLVFFHERATALTFIPLLIWSYGAATGVLAGMAQKDGEPTTVFNAVFLQIAYIAAIIEIIFFRPLWIEVAVYFCAVMCIPIMFSTMIAYCNHRHLVAPAKA